MKPPVLDQSISSNSRVFDGDDGLARAATVEADAETRLGNSALLIRARR